MTYIRIEVLVMNSKKSWSKKILLALGILIGLVGVSYALWHITLSGTNNNTITATCFNVSFTDQNNISIEKAYPLLDEEGKKLTPYEFTITNNCDTYVKYDINLEILNNSTLTNMDYIKLMLDDETPALVSSYDVTTKTLSNASTAYKIKMSYLNAKESKTYYLRLWLDENVTGETEGVQNNTFISKITVNASYAESAPEYCELNPNTAACQIETLAETDTTNLAVDDYGNTRYIGANPNNYVRVEGEEYTSDVYYGYNGSDTSSYREYSSLDKCTHSSTYSANCTLVPKGTPILWRIIGTMKDIDDGTGNKSDRLKLIRNDSIGEYSWDTSDSSVNSGNGVNEWSQADLMKLLNPGYENEEIGGSLYWNNKNGTCYYSSNNKTTSCDFTNRGINGKLKSLIGNAVWNTGANDGTTYTYKNMNASEFYQLERSKNIGKICTSGDYCNDSVERTTTWTGLVGLMYSSDYGYATSGGSTTDRATCLNGNLSHWSKNFESNTNQQIVTGFEDCVINNWIFDSFLPPQWTISSANEVYSKATQVFLVWQCVSPSPASNARRKYNIDNDGLSEETTSGIGADVFPTVYLKSSVKIASGSGSKEDPFVLGN